MDVVQTLNELAQSKVLHALRRRIEEILQKLENQGVHTIVDLGPNQISVEAFERKLSQFHHFGRTEMSDTVSLTRAAERWCQEAMQLQHRQKSCFVRSRSPRRQRNRDEGNYARSRGGGAGHQNARKEDSQHSKRIVQYKPQLWMCVENGDKHGVQACLARGDDRDETLEGWTPLMKAAEEGYVDIVQVLL